MCGGDNGLPGCWKTPFCYWVLIHAQCSQKESKKAQFRIWIFIQLRFHEKNFLIFQTIKNRPNKEFAEPVQ